MNRRVADSALLPYERQGSIVTYVTAVASAEKGARCALIFNLVEQIHTNSNKKPKPNKSFHSLEHTFAARAIEYSIDVKTLSEILGHKNPAVTMNRHAHSLMAHKQEIMNMLGRYYKRKAH